MENAQAFYKLSLKRQEIEESISRHNVDIQGIKDDAKKEKKGSEYRKALIGTAKEMQNSEEYKILKSELALMNFCINTVFY